MTPYERDTNAILGWRDERVRILAGPVPDFVKPECRDAYRLYEYNYIANLMMALIGQPNIQL